MMIEPPMMIEPITELPKVSLPDGGYAVYNEDDDIWEIFDDNDIPLGYINLPEGEDIQDYDVPNHLIPWESTPPKVPKDNPKTGDMLIFTLLGLVVISAGIMPFAKKKM